MAEAAAAEAEWFASPPPPPHKEQTPKNLPTPPPPSPSQTSTNTSVPPPPPPQTLTNTSVRETSPEDTGCCIRRLTEFGLQHQKAVEEQKAKAAARRADQEKAAHVKGDNGRAKVGGGAASKKHAVRGKKC